MIPQKNLSEIGGVPLVIEGVVIFRGSPSPGCPTIAEWTKRDTLIPGWKYPAVVCWFETSTRGVILGFPTKEALLDSLGCKGLEQIEQIVEELNPPGWRLVDGCTAGSPEGVPISWDQVQEVARVLGRKLEEHASWLQSATTTWADSFFGPGNW